jgi:hypothetical protein
MAEKKAAVTALTWDGGWVDEKDNCEVVMKDFERVALMVEEMAKGKVAYLEPCLVAALVDQMAPLMVAMKANQSGNILVAESVDLLVIETVAWLVGQMDNETVA